MEKVFAFLFHFAVAKMNFVVKSIAAHNRFSCRRSLYVQFIRQYNIFNYLIGHIYVMKGLLGE